LRDLGTVAGLYRSVFWMLGQQVRHGQNWQRHLYEESMRPQEEKSRERELVGTRHN
jgi:hypothetical protein